MNHVEHAADVIARAGKPNIKMQFDFYHAQIVGGDLLYRLEKYLAVVGHLQCAAVPTRHEPDEGEVNYPQLFAAVDRLGYTRLDRRRVSSARRYAGRPRLGEALWRGSALTNKTLEKPRFPALPWARSLLDLTNVRTQQKAR